MREIVFRGKRTDTGEWVEGAYYLEPYTDKAFVVRWNSTGMGYNEFVEVVKDTIGQYTGLKDANGKPIFEGDVVGVLRYRYGEIDRAAGYDRMFGVSMDEERRGWYPFACGDGCGCCEENVENPHDCEVVGNIHDDPDLPEGGG